MLVGVRVKPEFDTEVQEPKLGYLYPFPSLGLGLKGCVETSRFALQRFKIQRFKYWRGLGLGLKGCAETKYHIIETF